VGDRRIRAIQWLLGITIVGLALRSLVRNWDQLRAQPLDWSIEPGWLILSAMVVWLMYGLLIAAWRIMLTGWGRGLDFWSAARIWTVSSLGKYLPGKVWAVAGMAVMAQRAGVGAGPATASAIILQVLAIGTGAAVRLLAGALSDRCIRARREDCRCSCSFRCWPSECCCGPTGYAGWCGLPRLTRVSR
jgi:hypothetical protein